ncbi:hypothetical protein ACFLRC_00190 [Candidatus Altiarchaeota archaeon]
MKDEINLKFSQNPPQNLEELMQIVFWKEKDMAPIAHDFLQNIKKWQRTEEPYQVSQWPNYCQRAGISQSQYHNMLKRLRQTGIIQKRYNKGKRAHELTISEKFQEMIESILGVWYEFIKS